MEADRRHGLITVKFERVALTKEQVKQYGLPTAPAKETDSRAKSWTGGTCQLEALPPDVIADILRDAIRRHIDTEQLAFDHGIEAREREEIQRLLLPSA